VTDLFLFVNVRKGLNNAEEEGLGRHLLSSERSVSPFQEGGLEGGEEGRGNRQPVRVEVSIRRRIGDVLLDCE